MVHLQPIHTEKITRTAVQIEETCRWLLDNQGLTHAQKNGVLLLIEHWASEIRNTVVIHGNSQIPSFPGEHDSSGRPVAPDNLPF